jgi:hypothetical protein
VRLQPRRRDRGAKKKERGREGGKEGTHTHTHTYLAPREEPPSQEFARLDGHGRQLWLPFEHVSDRVDVRDISPLLKEGGREGGREGGEGEFLLFLPARRPLRTTLEGGRQIEK